MASSRLFIALPFSKEIREQYSALQNRARARIKGIRWVRPEQMHLTLIFLGQIETNIQNQLEVIIQDIAEDTPAFSVEVSGLGVFPNRRSPKVIWAGISEEEALLRCHDRLRQTISHIGLPCEMRAFRPHLTLGRIKERTKKSALNQWMAEEEALIPTLQCDMNTLMLMESQLGPEGPKYTARRRAPLKIRQTDLQ